MEWGASLSRVTSRQCRAFSPTPGAQTQLASFGKTRCALRDTADPLSATRHTPPQLCRYEAMF